MGKNLGHLKHRKYPIPIRLYNFFLGSSRFPDLEFDSLLKAAQKRTGLSDFGDESFVEPFKCLLESIEGEAALHSFGRFVTRKRFVDLLCNRLRAEMYFSKYPEILDAELRSVVLITGLQRTGTTMLHRLLASDPASRALMSWEALNPAPLSAPGSGQDPRIKIARISERGLKYIAPEFFAIHPVEHDAPEEEVLLLDLSFQSTTAEAILNVPSYKAWLENQDQLPGYEYMVKFLKLLQWQKTGKWWVLKSPHHLEHLEVLMKAIPRIKIVQTHRDPIETIPSFCSMIYHSRRIFSSEVDPAQIADQWSLKIAYMLEECMNVRNEEEKGRFFDLSYKKLISDPIQQIIILYKFLDMPVSESLIAHWNAILDRNKQHKYGVHNYKPEDFGLTKEGIKERLAPYRKHFKDYI